MKVALEHFFRTPTGWKCPLCDYTVYVEGAASGHGKKDHEQCPHCDKSFVGLIHHLPYCWSRRREAAMAS